MLSVSLLITIFFAGCIDRSFEDPNVIQCHFDVECLEAVFEHGLQTGVVPVIVTKNEDAITDQLISNFIDAKIPGIKILQVNVSLGKNTLTSNYLRVYPISKTYPFVVVMRNQRVLDAMVSDFDTKRLNETLEKAYHSPWEIDDSEKNKNFSYDLLCLIDKKKTEKKRIKQKVRDAAMASAQPTEEFKLPGLSHVQMTDWTATVGRFSNVPAISHFTTRKRSPSPVAEGSKRTKYSSFDETWP